MAWDIALQGIGAGLKGALDAYSWQQDQHRANQELQLREQAMAHDMENDAAKIEIERLKLELREMLETLKEQGRNERHATPSGSTVYTQDAASARNDATIASRERIAALQEQGRNERWFAPSGNALLQSETTRRGQDLNARIAAQRDATTRRGQDFGLATSTMNEAGRMTRHQTPSASSTMRAVTFDYGAPAAGTAAAPSSPRTTGTTPVTGTARPSAPPAAAGGGQIPPELRQRAEDLMRQLDASTDEDEKAVLRHYLQQVRDQITGGR